MRPYIVAGKNVRNEKKKMGNIKFTHDTYFFAYACGSVESF